MIQLLSLICCLLLTANAAPGQIARLTQHGGATLNIEAEPGDTLQLDLSAELGPLQVSGIAVYLQVPAGFSVLDSEASGGPFVPGDLFEDGFIVRNQRVTHDMSNLPAGDHLLEFSTVLGPSAARRSRSGSGTVAFFRVLCEEIITGDIRIFRSPIHESRVVMEDGRTEKALMLAAPVHIEVDLDTAVKAAAWGRLKAQPGR